LDKLRTALI